MRTEKFDGEIKSWWSKPLTALKLADGTFNTEKVLTFAGEFTAYGPDKSVKTYTDADWQAAFDEMTEAKDVPSIADIVAFKNAARLAKARQASMSAVITAAGLVQPTTANDDQLRLKKMAALYVDNGLSEADARKLASEQLKIDWI